MLNRSLVVEYVEKRMDLYGEIDEACLEINERQDEFAFESGEFIENETSSYYYWRDVNNDNGWFRLVDDFFQKVQYIDIFLPNEKIIDVVTSELCKLVQIKSLDNLKKLIVETPDSSIQKGVYFELGISVLNSFDSEVYNLLKKALGSERLEIRESATLAIFLLKWPNFKNDLEKSITKEQDMDLAAKMSYALSFCAA